ncbi:TolB family protein [Spirosoma sordidisoli]|uniref:Transporter n=1 Tax=Spirosoma sordidisoli TaxID=2502893 RepID=A0A4Q2ULN4_9BACT|nr:TolB family protein [Spirosoma sordidisoli]RYC70254.1 transporter [Spirosoma sordidisoli]
MHKLIITIGLSACLVGAAVAQSVRQPVLSKLEIYTLGTKSRRVVRQDSVRFEAPNWTPDGRHLIINERGRLYRVTVSDGRKERIDTGSARACNNDHGLTPDGKTLIISDNTRTDATGQSPSRIYTVPISGGEPTQITPLGPSYWHGVSPDGKTLAYVGERAVGPTGQADFDIYTVPITGGPETRLTTSPGLDDGPEYSPDGRYLYFNSYRTGRMQIWRMRPDGSQPEQITDDAYANWFPHPSPDGRWIVFISYVEDQKAAHPADKEVVLRLIEVKSLGQKKTGPVQELARFRGGQGTINVASWSPDSRSFAFVSY